MQSGVICMSEDSLGDWFCPVIGIPHGISGYAMRNADITKPISKRTMIV